MANRGKDVPARGGRTTRPARGPGAPRASARPGTSAPRTSRPANRPAARPERHPAAPRPGRVAQLLHGAHGRRTLWVVSLTLVAIVLSVLLLPTLHAWVQQRGEIEALTRRVAEQQAEVKDLQAQLDLWKDPAYVEQQARQRLKFVRPGEKAYTILDADPTVESGKIPVVDVATSSTGAWFSVLWGSVAAADAGTPPAGTGP